MKAEELRKFRDEKKMTQAQFAEELDVSVHAIQSWEQGKNPIPKLVQKYLIASAEVTLPIEYLSEIHDYSRDHQTDFNSGLIDLLKSGLEVAKAESETKPRPDARVARRPVKAKDSGRNHA